MLDRPRTVLGEEHEIFRASVRRFVETELAPHALAWDEAGIVPRAAWRRAGEAGLLCCDVAPEYGGPGGDFGHCVVVTEELARANLSGPGFVVHSDMVATYIAKFGSEDQKRRWLPGMVDGSLIGAIAMTEPDAGSDLKGMRTRAVADGDHYVIRGQKTYISNGQNADLIIVVAKTDPALGAKGTSLILVEADREGFARGRNLDKIGQHSADTSELFFNDVRVPITNCIGEENMGFIYLMKQLPQERLQIALSGQAVAQRAFDEAVKFTKERKAFGKTVFDFQNTKFTLADLATKLQIGWAHLDWALKRHVEGKLTAAEASAAKLWHTELQWDACDLSLQLHGGAGYMNEYPIARLWRDARVQRIYGGTSEIMKEVVSRTI